MSLEILIEKLLEKIPWGLKKLLCLDYHPATKAIVMPKKGLKTTLKAKLEDTRKIIVVDIEEVILTQHKDVKSVNSEEFLIYAKEYLAKVRASFGRRIVILTSKRDIARELGVNKRNICYMLPSQELQKELLREGQVTNTNMLDEIYLSYKRALSDSQSKCTIFDTVNELVDIVTKTFGIIRHNIK
jgi:hypothetical protein